MRDTINLLCGLALLPMHLLSNTTDRWLAMLFILFLFISYNLFQIRKTDKGYDYLLGVKKSLHVSIIGAFISSFFSIVVNGVLKSQNRGYNAEKFVEGIIEYFPVAIWSLVLIIPAAIALSFLIPLAVQFFLPDPDFEGSEDVLDKDEMKL